MWNKRIDVRFILMNEKYVFKFLFFFFAFSYLEKKRKIMFGVVSSPPRSDDSQCDDAEKYILLDKIYARFFYIHNKKKMRKRKVLRLACMLSAEIRNRKKEQSQKEKEIIFFYVI